MSAWPEESEMVALARPLVTMCNDVQPGRVSRKQILQQVDNLVRKLRIPIVDRVPRMLQVCLVVYRGRG